MEKKNMKITEKKLSNINITPEAEEQIEKAVQKYVKRLTTKSLEYTHTSGRKTLQGYDVELALKLGKL